MGVIARFLVAAGMIAVVICWILETAETFGANLFVEDLMRAGAAPAECRRRDEFTFHMRWIMGELAEGRLSFAEANRLMEAACAKAGAD